ncbi:hypothetical protein ACFPYJ_19535 [Paenibacillus solisilvae]|uniref:Uncharacterized protein n=1 Tax=Paenibacillus solisilvae TaxID=2486751 RepID=A0ABW0W2U5_9BACL
MTRKEVWQMSVEERLSRLLKRIPDTVWMNDEVVESTGQVPIQYKSEFSNDVKRLLQRLENHHHWWSKILSETEKQPKLSVIKTGKRKIEEN